MADDIAKHRAGIDALDGKIVALLNERGVVVRARRVQRKAMTRS